MDGFYDHIGYNENMKKYIIPASLVIVLTFITFFDLDISLALYEKGTLFGAFFKVTGYLPMIIMTAVSFKILGFKKWPVLFDLLSLTVLIAYMASAAYYINDHSMALLELTPILYVLIYMLASHIYGKDQNDAYKAAKWVLGYVIVAFAAGNILKIIWGRPRFYGMSDPLSEFRPWYLIAPLGLDDLHKSFPSLHTIEATMIFALIFYRKELKINGWAYIAMTGFVLLVGLSRIVEGAHFASDVFFGFLLSFGILMIIHRKYLMSDKREDYDNKK